MQIRNWQRQYMTVPVLVLQAFPCQSRAARGSSDQESSAAHIRSRPDQIPDTLESEHRVIDEEGNCVDSVIRIGSARRDERAHGARFRDAFFQNLSIFRFLVVEKRVHVDRFIVLADAGIDADLPEERFHAECASLVRNDGNDVLALVGITQQLRQQADEHHGG